MSCIKCILTANNIWQQDFLSNKCTICFAHLSFHGLNYGMFLNITYLNPFLSCMFMLKVGREWKYDVHWQITECCKIKWRGQGCFQLSKTRCMSP